VGVALEKYIASITPSPNTTTLLHGDFNPSNILKRENGSYGLIDWDLQSYGRPELDLWYGFSFSQPQLFRERPTKRLCDAYNASAPKPIIEGLLVAYGLAQLLRNYYHQLNDPKIRLSQMRREQILGDIKPRITGLAHRMHQLTGKRIYKDVQREFSKATYPERRPLRRLSRTDNILAKHEVAP
jgi:Ser/Thr protein kinase RdoA (MazF antagonist)